MSESTAIEGFKVGQVIGAVSAGLREAVTKPPEHYTDGTLTEDMANAHKFITDPEQRKKLRESNGIGTDRTRDKIVERLIKIGYLEMTGKGKHTYLISTSKGRALIASLPPRLTSPVNTAMWEQALTLIEEGKVTLDQFMAKQEAEIVQLHELIGRIKFDPNVFGGGPADDVAPMPGEGEACPECKKGTLRTSKVRNRDSKAYGKRFIACSERCKYVLFEDARPRSTAGPVEPMEGDGEACPKCKKGKMRTRTVQKAGPNQGKTFLSCDAYPKCNHAVWPS